MVQHQPVASTGAGDGSAGSLAASALQVGGGTTAVIDDLSAWPGENALGEYANAGEFENGDGSGEVVDGALRLEYDGGGWFLANVRQDVSAYDVLEIDVRGDGGELSDVQLEVGGVEGPLDELADGPVGTETSTLTVDLEAIGVDRTALQDVWLTFWQAGSGAIEIEAIRFGTDGEACDGLAENVATVDGQTVCDLDGDEHYRDVTGDGSVTNSDVTEFFANQHAPAWDERTELFDFTGDGNVGQSDVVALFQYI